MSFDLLSSPIRKYVRDKRWEKLRPIQVAAISRILTTDANYILASRTASGKTEAAFLPILSQVDFNEIGVQILYISPLVALINDQFLRVEELCSYLQVPVTKWHGEANRTQKNQLLNNPSGIVLITPESIEAMFVNKPFNVKQLFSNLKFVVIDEIHSFIGTDRGIQLKSLLYRLQCVNKTPFRIIGLSATIGDYDEAKKFTGNESNTKVLLDKTAKEMLVRFKYFKNKTTELPLALLKDLYIEARLNKVLIFPNSRGKVEEIAVKLKSISERVGEHANYFAHHSSVDKEVREYVEFFAKNNQHKPFSIACTSTLELGIDIGSVDKVVQIDATHSIASLVQRVGRSGRLDGQKSSLLLYATDEWSLLQSLATWILYQTGFIEPPTINEKPYDILLHQALSITKEHSGISTKSLVEMLKSNFAFSLIAEEDIIDIIHHLLKNDLLEKVQHELIIGIEGEKIVNSRDFYSVFKSEENFKVVSSGNTIGEVPLSPQIIENENILLAARIWKIVFVDIEAKKIEVRPTNDGKKPMFFGEGGIIHSKIREQMLSELYTDNVYDFLDEPSLEQLKELKKDFSIFKINDLSKDRAILVKDNSIETYTFTGSRINRTISLFLEMSGIDNTLIDSNSSIVAQITPNIILNQSLSLVKTDEEIAGKISELLEIRPTLLSASKWGRLLPKRLQIDLVRTTYYDIKGAREYFAEVNFIVANS